ncbi:LuxR C-terminal-related transcriptional regulator [Pseudomonas akapageensis]|uniref:LuxR C-terminal-related transcriptional regulator n=1 Tax=Pseudomonas akapageensis TaxID=2609961 RepID=UPI00140B1A5B|nr:LuxR C-terminal-related transcriptional regulator [Pseudomonas akapageensis]
MKKTAINATKLRPAPLPANAIARPKLLQRLQDAAQQGCLLTLISAPLGYGKSTLLTQYAASLNGHCAWYRCDASDNQAQSLLAHLLRALQLPVPDAADEPALWAAIVEHLEQRRERFTLIFDDLHLLRAQASCRYLDELLLFAPANLHVIGTCEGLPALAFGHLRRNQRLHMLEANSLALDSSETRDLAEARGMTLGSDAIYQLRASNEGWISGVLFGLGAHDERQAVEHTTQFFDEQVLRRLPPALLTFLERTSVVNAFDATLATHLSGNTHAAQLIGQLQRQDLFVEQRQGERLPYSYHPVFRRTLYQRLYRHAPDRLFELHRQAAAWLIEQQCYTEAVYQLGRAKDFNALLAAIERYSFDLLREGRVNAIVDFLSDIPGQSGADHFTLAMTQTSTVIVTNDIARARDCLQQLQRLLQRDEVPERHPERVHQTLAFLRSRLAVLGGNFSHGLGLIETALQRFPQVNAATAVLTFNRASCLFALGQLRKARIDAQQALSELLALGFSGYTNSLHMLMGLIELAQGQVSQAGERFLGLAQHLPSSASRSFYDLFHHLGQGLVLVQNNRLDQAAHHLNQAEAIALDFPHCAGLPWVFHYQACLHLAQGDLAQAASRLDEARRLARQFQLFALYRQSSAWRVRLAVHQHDQAFILDWLEEWHWCRRHYEEALMPEEWLAYAWVQRHLGQHSVALQISSRLQEQAAAEENQRLQFDLNILQATLHQDQGDRNAAFACLEQVLQSACTHGLGQLLQPECRDLGEPLRQLLTPQTRRQLGLEAPLAMREQLSQILRAPAPQSARETHLLLEPLTRREQDVLRRMASGQGNQQIADGLYISLSTVKTHINNLFRKLDASDRETALQVTRELKLLD